MPTRRIMAFAARALLFGTLWWVLTDGALAWDMLAVGVPAVLAAAALSTALLPAARWSPRGAVKFAAFFLWESLRGGVDVARRALAPRMALAPGVVTHEYAVESDLARTMIAHTSSLLPGSLALDLEPPRLCVHALDVRTRDAAKSVAVTERHVAELLPEPPGPQRGVTARE